MVQGHQGFNAARTQGLDDVQVMLELFERN